jgi:hypothetical protein
MQEKFYNYKNHKCDVSPLILSINTLGENLTGLELGIFQAKSTLTILQNCSIKKLYAIDSWKPYYDYLKVNPDGAPAYFIDEKQSEINRFISFHNIKYSGCNDKVEIIEEDSLVGVNKIKNNSLDFIFFDAMMTEEQTYNEARAFYPKIKKGGFFTGHDSNCLKQVIEPIKKVMQEHGNNNRLIEYDNCFLFKC